MMKVEILLGIVKNMLIEGRLSFIFVNPYVDELNLNEC